MHSHTQTYTVSELALAQRQQAANRKHKSAMLKTLQEQLNLLANTDLLLERVLETLTQVFTFDALVQHVYANECKAYVMQDERVLEIKAELTKCKQALADYEERHAQLNAKCMRLEADFKACQQRLTDSEKHRAELSRLPGKKGAARAALWNSFSDSESDTGTHVHAESFDWSDEDGK